MYPSDLCDLTHCSLQAPLNNQFTIFKNVVEYSSEYFYVDKDHIVCAINCGNGTSKASHYPRTELRGNSLFDSIENSHLEMDVAIMQVPIVKPTVCFAQVKTANAEIQFLCTRGKIIVRDFDVSHHTICDYKLGDWMHFRIASMANEIHIFMNRDTVPVLILTNKFLGAYWKAGCYTQSNATIDKADTMSKVCIKNLYIV
jgi:hypothetical protein